MSDENKHTVENNSPEKAREPDQSKNRPIKVFRDGDVKASVWRNEGKHGPMYKTVFAKLYEDRDGNLQETQSFDDIDLLKSGELGRHAYKYIADKKRQDRAQSRAQEQKPGQSKGPRQEQ